MSDIAADKASGLLLEGILEFPGALVLQGEHLGRSYQIRIGGVEGELVLPSIKPGWISSDRIPDLLPPVIRGAPIRQRDWGSVYSMPNGVTGVKAAVVRFELPPTADHAQEAIRVADVVRAESRQWLTRVLQWLAAFTKDPLFGELPLDGPQFPAGNPTLFAVPSNQPPKRVPEQVVLEVNLRTVTAPSAEDWLIALDRSSHGVSVPVEHALLNSARRALAQADYRSAVLDAATACELALSKDVGEAIDAACNAPKLAEFVKSEYDTLENLRKLSLKLGVDVPTDIRDVIGTPRRLAMHHGQDPDRSAASRALEMAEALVARACPISHATLDANPEFPERDQLALDDGVTTQHF